MFLIYSQPWILLNPFQIDQKHWKIGKFNGFIGKYWKILENIGKLKVFQYFCSKLSKNLKFSNYFEIFKDLAGRAASWALAQALDHPPSPTGSAYWLSLIFLSNSIQKNTFGARDWTYPISLSSSIEKDAFGAIHWLSPISFGFPYQN